MRVSVVYCWAILTGSPAESPHAMGACLDRDKAVADAEQYLLRGEGFLATVEPMRPSISTFTLDPCYQRTGIRWIGRRSRTGGVLWSDVPQRSSAQPIREDGAMKLRIFTEPQQGASYAALRAVAKTAERLGFDGFFRSDHYLKMGDVSGLPGPTDAWATLAALATETTRLRLGTLMTSATFRLPGPLAITVAQVDDMSGGRVEFGFGAGWYEAEHTGYGIPFPPVAERFDRFAEQLAIITGLWETPPGQTFSFDGQYYKVTDSPALPKTPQHPRPPVIIGGSGARRTPALAARYADEFNAPFLSPSDSAVLYDRVRAACRSAGRDPASMIFSAAQVVCCGRDLAELERRAAAIGRSSSDLREHGLAGTPDEIVAKIEAFAAVGVSRLYLQILDLDDLEHLELIASEVGAALADVTIGGDVHPDGAASSGATASSGAGAAGAGVVGAGMVGAGAAGRAGAVQFIILNPALGYGGTQC